MFRLDSGEIFGSGCNTDGQLGLGPSELSDIHTLTRVRLPEEVNNQRISSIHSGGDTSGLITDSGELWTWGNSEYSQAMHGSKIDQILEPKKVERGEWSGQGRRLIDWRCGGSFSLALDSESF